MKKVLITLFVCALFLTGCNSSNKSEYGNDLKNVAVEILENSAKAEELLNGYSKIWRFSIESGSAISVSDVALEIGLDEDDIRKYFELNNAGNVPGDFSINVGSMQQYYRATGRLDEIEEASDDIKSKVSKLNNPPSEYEKAFDEVLDMHIYSEEYIGMAIEPNGSLQTFNESRNQLSSEILGSYKRIEALIPNNN